MADDFTRKAVILVTFSVDRRSHAWLPILVFAWSLRVIAAVIMSWAGNDGQQLDNATGTTAPS
jgi:hypothetical protein